MLLEEKRSSFQLEGSFFSQGKQFSKLFTCKDKINKLLHSNLVYKFQRNICNDIYYGKTKHHFKVRAYEHLGTMSLTGKKVKIPKESAVFDHIFHADHNAIFDDFETLAKEFDEFNSFSESHF